MKIKLKVKNYKYDINREAAKISALSSGEIDKYEYLKGEEILPSNQQRITEQAKFTYSPLGKAFEKQIKTIENQGEKQTKAIQDKQLVNLNKDVNYKDKLILSKEREIFKDIYNKRLDKIEELNNIINYDNLWYTTVNGKKTYDFSTLKDPRSLLEAIKKGAITLQEAKNTQQDYLEYLNTMRKGNKNNNQKRTLANINFLFDARNNAIKCIEDYGSMILEAKILAREQEGTGLKIFTPNQMLKRLPITLAQVTASNNSESLLNEIRQIVFSLYRSKEITKKVYNNIINSIKV